MMSCLYHFAPVIYRRTSCYVVRVTVVSGLHASLIIAQITLRVLCSPSVFVLTPFPPFIRKQIVQFYPNIHIRSLSKSLV